MTDNAKTLIKTLVEIYGRIGDFHITPCDGAIPISEADRLAEKAVEDYTNAILSEERNRVVAWLRLSNVPCELETADEIEAGYHLK